MDKKDLRIVFMGTPEFAVESLKSLVEGGYNVVAVVTQPDRPVGRHGSELHAPAVKQYALQHELPVLQPEKMKAPEFVDALKSYKADLQIVVAFRMLPEIVWAMPHFGTFNVHAALLPQYRGAAPINWAIINGETETGITTFFLDREIDTGNIIMKRRIPIYNDYNVEDVYYLLMGLGARICLKTVEKLLENDGKIEAIAQSPEGEVKPAPKIFKETCLINWDNKAKKIYDFIRGLSPYPCAWTNLTCKDRSVVMKIYKAQKRRYKKQGAPGTIQIIDNRFMVNTQDYLLEITELLVAGKKRVSARNFLNGFKSIETYHLNK